MKKPYVKPVAVAEIFEVNESISACTLAANGVDTSKTYNCDQVAHIENVSFEYHTNLFGFNFYYVKDEKGTVINDWGVLYRDKIYWGPSFSPNYDTVTSILGNAYTDHVAGVAPNHS